MQFGYNEIEFLRNTVFTVQVFCICNMIKHRVTVTELWECIVERSTSVFVSIEAFAFITRFPYNATITCPFACKIHSQFHVIFYFNFFNMALSATVAITIQTWHFQC